LMLFEIDMHPGHLHLGWLKAAPVTDFPYCVGNENES